jgi:predicted Zn-dependent protease
MRKKEEIQELLHSVLHRVNEPEAQAEYFYRYGLASRFGENAITQNIGGMEEILRVVVASEKKHGSSITNRLDGDWADALVHRAEDIARNSPVDPEYMPPAEPKAYPAVPKRYFDDVERVTPGKLASDVQRTVRLAQSTGYKTSGSYEVSRISRAIANTQGLFCFDEVSNLSYSNTMHGPSGSGYSGQDGESVEQIDAESMAQGALETAAASQNPASIGPGDYTAIFEPQAVWDFLAFLLWNMSARDAEEGTSVFAGTLGSKLFSEKVNLATRIDDPSLPAPPFGEDGIPARNTVWVRDGVIERLHHDRYWASNRETEPDPLLFPLFMDGQDQSVQDLISGCRRCLLVKRLWYIRYVDRRDLLLTGMTRDGLFLVEDGRVIRPVKNLRFNESPVFFLQNVLAMSRPERVGSWAKVPAIMSEGFTFSSGTESV